MTAMVASAQAVNEGGFNRGESLEFTWRSSATGLKLTPINRAPDAFKAPTGLNRAPAPASAPLEAFKATTCADRRGSDESDPLVAKDYAYRLGPLLQTKSGMRETNEVLNGKRAVLLYFSASWCRQRSFTAKLARALSDYGKGDVEVVFLSADSDEASFNQYYDEMPWTALPYSNRAKKDKLTTDFGPAPTPQLVVLKGTDGSVSSGSGVKDLMNSRNLEEALHYWGV